jgi:DNA-binding IclR family transcriptional regulator
MLFNSMNERSQMAVPAIERALTVLETIAQWNRGFTLSELCRRLSLPKSSMSLILGTLEHRGYLQKERHTRKYRFGPKLVGLSRSATEHLEFAEEARPFLQSLMEKTGFCVHLAILDGNEAIMIEKVNAPGRNRITTTWPGQRVPAHCTGIGKAMIAFLSEEDFQRQIASRGLWKYNENTITSIEKLKQEMEHTRHRGYSVSNEESQIGFRGIGGPVLDTAGKVIAGISIDGRVAELSADLIPALGKVVKQTAATISAYLAHGKIFPWEPGHQA